LKQIGNQTYCYLAVDGKAVRTPVQTGVSDGTWVEVTGKLVRRAGASEGTWEAFDGKEAVIDGDLSEISDGLPVTGGWRWLGLVPAPVPGVPRKGCPARPPTFRMEEVFVPCSQRCSAPCARHSGAGAARAPACAPRGHPRAACGWSAWKTSACRPCSPSRRSSTARRRGPAARPRATPP